VARALQQRRPKEAVMRKLIALAIAVAAMWLALPAAAQPVGEATNVEEARLPPGAHHHGGFYLRLGTGFGSFAGSVSEEDAADGTDVRGVASVGEFAIGGAVRPGIILGAGFYSSTLLASDRDVHGRMPPEDVLDGGENMTLFGPFVDVYVDPTGGMHFQGAVGVATGGDIAVGAGLMLGAGYEWWVSDEWAIGVMGRLTASTAVTDEIDGVQWSYGVSVTPSILFTATYN
jgi:hypothetical protein